MTKTNVMAKKEARKLEGKKKNKKEKKRGREKKKKTK